MQDTHNEDGVCPLLSGSNNFTHVNPLSCKTIYCIYRKCVFLHVLLCHHDKLVYEQITIEFSQRCYIVECLVMSKCFLAQNKEHRLPICRLYMHYLLNQPIPHYRSFNQF
jgi:hypothetical protein